MYPLLKYIPKNYLSFLAGILAGTPIPKRARSAIYKTYAKRYAVNLEEVEKSLDNYPSLAAFFVRNLKPGSRSIAEGVVSPVDGLVSECGQAVQGRLLQVKGREYELTRLLRDSDLARSFVDGHYVTIYLAPGDYHHIHAPVSGRITRSIYIEGRLWPVNSWSVANIDGVFCQNERVICVIDSVEYGRVAVVMVGATNVGAIRLAYDSLRANGLSRLFSRGEGMLSRNYKPEIVIQRGEKIGSFYLGSTVVLIFEKNKVELARGLRGQRLRLGQSLG